MLEYGIRARRQPRRCQITPATSTSWREKSEKALRGGLAPTAPSRPPASPFCASRRFIIRQPRDLGKAPLFSAGRQSRAACADFHLRLARRFGTGRGSTFVHSPTAPNAKGEPRARIVDGSRSGPRQPAMVAEKSPRTWVFFVATARRPDTSPSEAASSNGSHTNQSLRAQSVLGKAFAILAIFVPCTGCWASPGIRPPFQSRQRRADRRISRVEKKCRVL